MWCDNSAWNRGVLTRATADGFGERSDRPDGKMIPAKAPKSVRADVHHDPPNPAVGGETTNVWGMGCRTSSKTTRMGLGSIRFIIPGANSDSAHCALSLDLLARSVSQEGPTAPAHSLVPHFTNVVRCDEGDTMTLTRLYTPSGSTATYGTSV